MDLDAFFASVEQLLRPELRDKAIVVGGNAEGRGVVSAASYPARRYGIHSAMPVRRALERCPHLIVVHPRHKVYADHSRHVMDILYRYTPRVEQLSIDEAFLDVTAARRIWGTPLRIAKKIKQQIQEEQGLPASLGVASNKLVAKIACDAGKPDGLTFVESGREAEFLAPHDVEALWGVGAVTAQRLRQHGLYKVGDLAALCEDRVVALLGEQGKDLWKRAQGIDESAVVTHQQRKSISKEHTFAQDTTSMEHIRRQLLAMSDELTSELRQRGWVAQTVRLKLRDNAFQTITRQVSLEQPTDQPRRVYKELLALLDDNWSGAIPVRLIGAGLEGLLRDSGYQLRLLEERDEKQIRLNKAVDSIREKFGREAIKPASLLDPPPPSQNPSGKQQHS